MIQAKNPTKISRKTLREEVRLLGERSFEFAGEGFETSFFAYKERRCTDVVNLGYVLNVIEDERERCRALAEAWRLTR